VSEHLQFQQVAARSLDFDISPADEDELSAHLRDCAACRRFASGIRSDDELARSRSRTHSPDRVRQAVVAAASRPAPRSSVGHVLPILGAAAVAIVLLAGFAWLARPRTDGPGQLPGRSFTRLGDVPAFANGTVSDVFGTGAQLIAVGKVSDGASPVAAVWMSADGLSWQRLPTDATFAGTEALNVAAHGDTLIVLGPGHGTSSVRVWLSQGQRSCASCSVPPSGHPWQAASLSFPGGRDEQPLFAAIASGGPGFVFVGAGIRIVDGKPVPMGAIVATSPDGATWSFNDPASPEFAGGSMSGVAAGPSGVVAVGETGVAPTVWTSVDGLSWRRLSDAISGPGLSLRSVAAGPAGFVAVGDAGGSAASWVSADGSSWQASPASEALANARMLHVAWLGSEFVAIGESAGDGIAWSSADGLTWTRLETGTTFTGAQMQVAGAIGSRLLLFGTDASGVLVAAVGEGPGQH
jgi:hypothetical protein